VNQRNVDALKTILDGEKVPIVLGTMAVEEMAEYLASCGVLVPSAVTNEEAVEIKGWWEEKADEAGSDLREELERIAKGVA